MVSEVVLMPSNLKYSKPPTSVWGSAPRPSGWSSQGTTTSANYSTTPAPTRLPLSSAFEAGRRGIDDDYEGTRAQVHNQMGQIDPNVALQFSRFGTYQGRDDASANEDFSNRGIFNSGFRQQKLGQIDYDYDTQRTDVALDAARERAALTQQLDDAARARASQLQELLLQTAQNQGQVGQDLSGFSPYAGTAPAAPTNPLAQYKNGGWVGHR